MWAVSPLPGRRHEPLRELRPARVHARRRIRRVRARARRGRPPAARARGVRDRRARRTGVSRVRALERGRLAAGERGSRRQSARSARSRSCSRGSRALRGSSPTGSAQRSWSWRAASAPTRPSTSRSGSRRSASTTSCVETAGAVPAVELATRLVREGGRVVLLGIAGEGRMLASLPADRIALRDLELIGSVGYTSAAWGRLVGAARRPHASTSPRSSRTASRSRSSSERFELMENREGIVAKIVLEHTPRPRLTLSTCFPRGAFAPCPRFEGSAEIVTCL